MASRLASAFVGVPIVIAALWAGAPWLSMLAAVLASLGAVEFYRMAEQRGARPATVLGVAWALVFVVSGHSEDYVEYQTTLVAVGGGALTLAWHLARRFVPGRAKDDIDEAPDSLGDTIADWGNTAAGAIYTGWTLSLFLRLRAGEDGLEWVLLAVLATFATDTGAFLVGRAIGRRRMAPRISPGKTWEGAIGGWVAGVGAVVGLAALLDMPLTQPEAIVLGALIGVAAQVGDLVESILKRAAGVKDSGTLIPGHGGVLDRLDSVVFAVVVVYHFSVWTVG
ncbi:MAG: phosphatidate cytidylyltransferase [Chloroflexota bacterium]|nr:phosphatidate cytidylyltransferase [Chloroflexota bacterium]MDE2940858.1 phosphatidate cytidylyltransferase [Chloroflexota bacterium]MDE3267552.1 phosphatidate cytidylyltransferase [Chloroflexota bacterium]